MKRNLRNHYPSVATIDEWKHVEMVKEIFSTIFPKYDLLNHVLSCGCDIIWRRRLVRGLRFFQTYRFLDVATGTGELALEAARKYPAITVTGIDFVEEMMDIARRKIEKRNLSRNITLFQGDALALPFEDDSFDSAAIAFGIRNISDRVRALSEMRRVVVPGGQVMVLEMNLPYFQTLKAAYSLYLNNLLPRTAALFSKNPAAYHYLADSIMHFPSPEKFTELMEQCGLVKAEAIPLTFGITYLYRGVKNR